jgi:uncharacterized membrane protein YphA (DoxX/SURF4 family)
MKCSEARPTSGARLCCKWQHELNCLRPRSSAPYALEGRYDFTNHPGSALRCCLSSSPPGFLLSFRGCRPLRVVGSLRTTTRRLGRFSHFVAYTAKLNWFVPAPAITALAWMATAIETALGVALLLGVFPRLIAALSGILLLAFALTMTMALGIKAPLDASVFSASYAAFLLAFVPWRSGHEDIGPSVFTRSSHRLMRRYQSIPSSNRFVSQLLA